MNDTMKLDQGAVQTAVEDAGADFDQALYEGYRGRGMETETWGLRLADEVQIDTFFAELAEFDAGVSKDLMLRARRDSLGRGLIVYFPGVELVLR
jgi:hypothetical protein